MNLIESCPPASSELLQSELRVIAREYFYTLQVNSFHDVSYESFSEDKSLTESWNA